MTPSKLFNLTGKVAIVTGGANGIGTASCRMLAEYGAAVVIADLNIADAQKLADEIIAHGGKPLAAECNVLEDDDLVALVNLTMAEFSAIHI